MSIDADDFTTDAVEGDPVDTEGWDFAYAWIDALEISDGTWTPVLQESESADSGFAAVAEGDIRVGPHYADGGVLPAFSTSRQVVYYVGSKRYLRWTVQVSGSPSTGAKFKAGVDLTYQL